MRMAWSSPAALAIAPLQDLLNLGSEARMNVPGRADGNWRWRVREDMLSLKRFNGLDRKFKGCRTFDEALRVPSRSIQVVKGILLVVSALFPIVDPIGGSPIFLSLTRDYTTQTRRLLSRRIAVDSFILLIASFAVGSHVLSFFGISLPVVQVGGGLIVIRSTR
jgi:hypothetical protein